MNYGTCRVSIDGTWQKRGHVSLNDVVTACHNGECINVHIISKRCRKCNIKKVSLKNSECNERLMSHDCNINHKGSSGSMEGAGSVELFSRSV